MWHTKNCFELSTEKKMGKDTPKCQAIKLYPPTSTYEYCGDFSNIDVLL
jgi:hypothetical protein